MPARTHNRAFNTAGLEADVMRFMAIIAFCLIAMMALIKPQPPEAIPTTVSPPADPRPLAPSAYAGKDTRVERKAVVTEEIRKEPPVPKVVSIPESTPDRVEKPSSPDLPQPDTAPGTEETRGTNSGELALRFESERSFFRLLAGGEMKLYVSTASGFIGLDRYLSPHAAIPKGALYEVMRESVPKTISRLFQRRSRDAVYLVSLPERTRLALQAHLGRTRSGTLIIHRDGTVTHEDPLP